MKRIFGIGLAVLLLGLVAVAQEAPQTKPEQEPAPVESNASDVQVEGVYTYSPKSHRDPFVSPFDLEQLRAARSKRPGIQGMSINEVVVQGVIRSYRGYEAFVLGSDNKVYWVRAGDELYDGKVLSVGMGKNPETGRVEGMVVFRQDVDDPNQLKPYRDITKYVNK